MRKVMLAAFLAFASLSRLLTSTRIAITNKSVASSFDTCPFAEQLSMRLFLIAPPSRAVQNEGHSTVILPIQERTICAPHSKCTDHRTGPIGGSGRGAGFAFRRIHSRRQR